MSSKPLRERIVCLHWKRTTVHLSPLSSLVVLRRESGTVTPATRTGHSRSTRPSACPVAICQKGKETAKKVVDENVPQTRSLDGDSKNSSSGSTSGYGEVKMGTIRAASKPGATFLYPVSIFLLSPQEKKPRAPAPTRSHEKKSTKGQQQIALLKLLRSQCSYRGRWKEKTLGPEMRVSSACFLNVSLSRSLYFSPHKTFL